MSHGLLLLLLFAGTRSQSYVKKKLKKKGIEMIEKFRGALYGVLVGDCFGALFQETTILSVGSRLVLKKFLDSLEHTTNSNGIYTIK